MLEYAILDQSDSRILRKNPDITNDNHLRERYLKGICLLRGKVYIDEGLYTPDILTPDGQFKEKWDQESIHFIAMDNDKVVGCLRLTSLHQRDTFRDAEIDYFLNKFNLTKHKKTYQHLLSDWTRKGRMVVELSRLCVEEEYRRFRNINSQVSVVLFTMSYSYSLENGVNDALIVQGNKYRTSNIYERIGFYPVRDIETDIPLEPFFDGSDLCQMMHFSLENPTELFKDFVNRFKPEYEMAKIIKPA